MTDLNALPPRFPGAPDITDTHRLWQALPGLYAALMTFVSQTCVKRGAPSRLWAMHRLLHVIYRAEVANFRRWLVQSLRRDPAWQAQVQADLGGERALSRWKLRRARLEIRAFKTASTPRQNQRHRSSTPIKTDRYGLFRLAALRRTDTPLKHRVYIPRARYRIPCSAFLRPSPTPITPRDLRPEGQARSGNLPSLSRQSLMRLWLNLQCHLQDWNMRIAFADMDMSLIGGRKKTPP